MIGAALFGVGWGMSGICPGPAISLIAFWPRNILVFLLALFVGSYAGASVHPQRPQPASGGGAVSEMTEAIVVGGGLAGIAAAVAVAQAGLETLHVAPKGPPDRRTSALMLPSVDYLRGRRAHR